jgi:hypothetical protein
MLFPLILAIFYYDLLIGRIPRWIILLAVLVVLVGISALQLLQGTAASIADTVGYFDYFHNTALFLDGMGNRFHFTWGATWLSSFWGYVPRGLFPYKPYAYGIAAIMEDFQPGAAELGSTDGILPWAASYLDFGVFGVAVEGLILGFVAKAVFENVRERPSMSTLLIFAQFGLQTSQPIYGAPLPLFWLWLVAQVLVAKAASMARHDLYGFCRSRGLLRPRSSVPIVTSGPS